MRLITACQVAVGRFLNPQPTLPMLLERGGQIISHRAKTPLRYHWIDLSQMPEMFLKHLWMSEDQRFFQHDGFDWKEMDLAMKKAERTGKPVRGASTITNQCARSIFLWQGRSWIRKGLESYYTLWMEALLPKRRILELYANVIEMGRGIYGVEAAAHHFFGVSARGLCVGRAWHVAVGRYHDGRRRMHRRVEIQARVGRVVERLEVDVRRGLLHASESSDVAETHPSPHRDRVPPFDAEVIDALAAERQLAEILERELDGVAHRAAHFERPRTTNLLVPHWHGVGDEV